MKLKNFPEGKMTEMEWVGLYADRVAEVKLTWEAFFDRRKFNRLSGDEQEAYEAELEKKAARPQYRAYQGEEYYVISKPTYLYFAAVLRGKTKK